MRSIDYSNHTADKIKIIPPDSVIKDYEKDYAEMAKFMIYGEALTFSELIRRIMELQDRIHKMKL